ncbi:transposase [Streptomyces sp. NPDC004539]|uniref:IS701 family transposase n=1 Tax=Streptomyces sp. NPDC004539 TaxID=3154280 RepID=UPI0033A5E4EA
MPALGSPTLPAPCTDRTLSTFSASVFGYLPRSDQRRWANAYLCGLLTVTGRKTIRQIARATRASDASPQALQQFISASPWDWTTAREALARTAAHRLADPVWTLGTTLIEKRGDHSVGVHRRVLPESGRVLNCQVGTGLFLTSEHLSSPVDWQLLLPDGWLADEPRRSRARIPSSASGQPSWMDALDRADLLTGPVVPRRAPLVADLSTGISPARLAAELTARRRDFVIEVRPGQLVAGADGASAFPGFTEARRLLRATDARHPRPLGCDHHEPGRRTVVRSTLVRLPGGGQAHPAGRRVHRLLAELLPAQRRPLRYWITSLVDHRIADVVRLTHRATLTHGAVRTLEGDYGLRDFEGRSFPGWHHHMTLASAAYVYDLFQGATDSLRAA